MAKNARQAVTIDYTPQPKQLLFHECTADEVFYGGAVGGGKSYALFWDAVNACINVSKYCAAIFRKTFPELEATHIRRARELPKALGRYNASLHQFQFINGSLLEFNYCERESDVYRYMSQEWDALYMDELTHFTEFQYIYLMTRVRTTKPGLITKVKSGSNPGNVGHAWVRDRFVKAAKEMTIFKPEQSDIEKEYGLFPRTRCFIPAKLTDNEALSKADPNYMLNLLQLPEDERKMLIEGDWDRYVGQFFTEWRHDIHVVDDFSIPDWWYRFIAYDHGFSHNAAFGWFAVDEDGNIYLYRELVRNRTDVRDLSRLAKKYDDFHLIKYMVAGGDIWLPPRDGIGKSVAESYAAEGFQFSPAIIERVIGWAQVRAYLQHKEIQLNEDGQETWVEKPPRFRVFRSCARSIETIPVMIHDKRNSEDMLKVDANEKGEGGDDAMDMIRYGLMTRPLLAKKPKDESKLQRFIKRRRQRAGVTQMDRLNQDV